MGYWIRVPGHGFFIRFESHTPPRWFTTRDRQHAYCFASQQDAQRVADQLKGYGRAVTVVTEPRRTAAPRSNPSGAEQMWSDKIRTTTLANKPVWDKITKLFALADEARNDNVQERSRAWSRAWHLIGDHSLICDKCLKPKPDVIHAGLDEKTPNLCAVCFWATYAPF